MTSDSEDRLVELLEKKLERRNIAAWERHLTTGMVTLLLAAVGGGAAWVSDEISKGREQSTLLFTTLADTNSEVKLLKFQIDQLTRDIGRSVENHVLRREFDEGMRRVERRLTALEGHVREDEKGWAPQRRQQQ